MMFVPTKSSAVSAFSRVLRTSSSYLAWNDLKSVLSAAGMQVFHVNDYPADPPREKIADRDRVYPGDGVAPLGKMLRDLKGLGFRGMLSLELFNPTYWKQDPLEVAKTGLTKLKAVVEKAMKES